MHTARFRDLALVFSFMKRIQVRDVLELIDDIHEAVFTQLDWLDPHRALNRHNSMKAYFTYILRSDQEPTPGPAPITYRIAILATWLCLDEEVMRITRNQTDQSVTRLPNHDQMLEIYEEYVHWIWQHVNQLLRRLELALPDVVSIVGELVEPTELQYCLSYPSVPGFEAFLAQVQARSEYRPRNQCHIVEPASQDVINGNWMLLSPTLAVLPDNCTLFGSPSISTLPITSLLAFCRQFGAIAVHFDPTTQIVRVTSLLFPREHDSEQALWSHLVLDRQLRHFDSFPSGEFTVTMSIDGYSVGDYIGYYDTSKRALPCKLYAWPDQSCSSTGQTNFRLFYWLQPMVRGSHGDISRCSNNYGGHTDEFG